MPIMAKSNDEYTEVKAIKTPDGTEIDYVLSKVDNTYKRTYTATREFEDAPPLEFKSIKPNANLTDYRIYGQTSRNLFNETIYNKNVDYVTFSTTCPKTIIGDYDPFNSRYIFIISGNVDTGASNAENGVSYGAPRTIQPSNGYVTIAYRKIESYNVRPWEYQTMLNEGSTVLPYEPYGESVGDLVTSGEHAGEYKVPVTVGGNLFDITNYLNSITSCLHGTWSHSSNNFTINATASDAYLIPFSGNDAYKIAVFPNTPYTISFDLSNSIDDAPCNIIVAENGSLEGGYMHQIGVAQKAKYTLTTRYDTEFVTLRFALSRAHTSQTFSHIMFNEGSTALPYETYQPPVTTTIYLPEQIKKVGDEAEYIDYGEQKFHRISGADLDVTLPALPTVTGTNVLSVGTEVQPSDMYIKGNFKMIAGGGE